MAAFQFHAFILAFCILLRASTVPLHAEPQKIVVSQQNGKDNSTCGNEKTIPCQSLNYALGFVKNYTFVYLEPGPYSYNLTEHFNFSNMNEIGVVGNQGSSFVSIDCHLNGSLSFDNSNNITFKGILLRGCGGKHNSTTGDAFHEHAHIPFLSALFFVYCKDILIENCFIVQSPGIGVNMYDVGGEVLIMHSTFENNKPIENISATEEIAVAGGGVYVEFTFKGGLFPFNRNQTELAEYDSNAIYTFYNCTFRNNSAPNQTNFLTLIDNPHGDDHFPFGRGGGLSLFIKGAAKSNLIEVNFCHFEDNFALWGGGVFIEYQDEVQNNTFHVANCTFRNNKAHYAGGAIRSGTCAQSDILQLLANKLFHKYCTFKKNEAIFGGAVSHHGTLSYMKDPTGKAHYVRYVNCEWVNNYATMGAALGLATSPSINGLGDLMGRGPLLAYRIDLEDCNITSNGIILTEDDQVIGQGAIYSYSVPVIFRGVLKIENNNNTAVVIENAALHVFGNVTFQNNTGGQGGALGLYGTSVIMLMPHSQLKFVNNTASEQGGALYMRDSGPPVMAFNTTELNTRACIIAYNNTGSLDNVTQWQTKVVFVGNKVLTGGGGNSVFASTLSGCRRAGEPRINNSTLEWKNTMQYLDPDKTPGEQISTDAVQINVNEADWHVSPSEKFSAFVKLIDEKNSSVMGIVKLTIISDVVRLVSTSNLFLIQKHDNQIKNLHMRGKQASEFTIGVNTVAGRVVRKLSGKITLKDCYPGFESNDDESCSCLKEHGISYCSADSKYVFLRRGYWGGMAHKNFVTYPCPPHHCNPTIRDNLTFEFSKETICNKGRNGSSVLCGACNEGYSVNLGDEECKEKCSNSHLWLLLVIFIVTVVLVLVVLRIELDIFTTYLNAWLYSYQIMTFLVQEGQYLDPVITFIIGAANWRVKRVGICLFHGMDNLQKLGINYILPAYVLLVLLVLVRIARCRPSCYINRNVSRAFCTLLVLCYTNVTMISWDILHYVPLNGRWVLYADGNIEFVRDWKKHLPYTIIAVLWIICFVLFLPLVLLFTPWFKKWIPILENFRLFFDNFQKCFQDRYRWFAAFYFICRVYILSIAMFVPFGPLRRSILEVSCVTIAVICIYLRPYRTTNENEDYSWLNTLDAVLLTNLCFVVIFSSSIVNDTSQSIQDGLENTVDVLAYVPLVYLIILICYHGWNYCCPRDFNGYEEIEPERPSSPTDSSRPAQPI